MARHPARLHSYNPAVCQGFTFSLATFHALVELHAHGFDDLTPSTPDLRQTTPGRSFSFFWLPKLTLAALSTALSIVLWGGFVLETQVSHVIAM